MASASTDDCTYQDEGNPHMHFHFFPLAMYISKSIILQYICRVSQPRVPLPRLHFPKQNARIGRNRDRPGTRRIAVNPELFVLLVFSFPYIQRLRLTRSKPSPMPTPVIRIAKKKKAERRPDATRSACGIRACSLGASRTSRFRDRTPQSPRPVSTFLFFSSSLP